jgi:type II secretory pathway pseudopilin PulG
MVCSFENAYPHLPRPRGGFTFTEVLFAVMILGIGFIMIAAMFPVAIRQTQDTVEEATAGSMARNAALILQRVATNANFPPTQFGQVANYNGYFPNVTVTDPTHPSFWETVGGDLISSNDGRYAWMPFYCRAKNSSYAQVIIVAMEARAPQNTFTTQDLGTIASAGGISNLQGRSATAQFKPGIGAAPDTIQFMGGNGLKYAAEGAFVIIADDHFRPAVVANPTTSCDGYVYRIGNVDPSDPSNRTWDLMPGSDMKTAVLSGRNRPTGAADAPFGLQVFVVGAAADYANNGLPVGTSMDIAAYTTFIQIHN